MKITTTKDVKIGVFDIETLREMFDIGVYDPDSGEWREFEISKRKNELYQFIKYYTSKPHDYWVSFNGNNFDIQVLEYIKENYQNWFDLSNLEICSKIADFAHKRIDDQNYNISPPYEEDKFTIPSIDLFKIHHFDNKAKMTS